MSKPPMKSLEYSEISEWFYLDPTSPSGLRWLQDCGMRGKSHSNYRFKDDAAGYKSKNYWIIGFKNKEYAAARIVYCLAHRGIPVDKLVDHIDGDTFNNNIENLRLVDYLINGRNRKKNINNKTGYPSISRVRIPNRCGDYNHYYRVLVKLQTKTIIKSFNIGVLGEELALQNAIKFKESLFPVLKLDGYTERHINE